MLKHNNKHEHNGHKHEHNHGESCDCGHEHNHDEGCDCGHDHHHDEGCGCKECASGVIGDLPGVIRIERRMHDEAIVISGTLTLFADYEAVRTELAARLEDVARAVSGAGGVVGHIKASATVTRVDMFSVTDETATVKGTPESEIAITLAAIVFLIPPEEAEAAVRSALEAVKKIQHIAG